MFKLMRGVKRVWTFEKIYKR